MRKENTVFFVPFNQKESKEDHEPEGSEVLATVEEDSDRERLDTKNKRVIPIEGIENFMFFNEITFNSRFLNFLTQHNIPAHVFNYHGFYSGSYYPREYLNSGFLMVSQVEHYKSKKKRMILAKSLVDGASMNMLRNLKYYNQRDKNLEEPISKVEDLRHQINDASEVDELMGIEGNIRMVYYSAFPSILKEKYDFDKRVKQPPDNAVNALISFGNAMVYTACLSEIYRTQLSPLISWLHQPGERRYSLALDLAEIFKPIFTDRILFKCLNQRIIQPKHFDKNLNYCYLKDTGRKAFVKEFEDRMKTTIEHRKLNRKVSYRRLIRLECYKLVKHITGAEQYEPFKAWW